MRYGSICDGIHGSGVAWSPLGWECAWRSEIDKFPDAVARHHWPDVPNVGDFTKMGNVGPVDLLVGGTPCQSFSVAGKRAGLDDPRGNLALEFLALAKRLRPRWLVFENVPGLLSNWSGAETDSLQPGQSREFIESSDFAAFLGAVRECGYLGCWRVLDAQYAGLAQRRERVFFVGYLGDWRPAAAVLFERESLSGHPPPRRKAGEGTAGGAATGPLTSCGGTERKHGHGWGQQEVEAGLVIPVQNATRGKDQNGLGIGGNAMFTLDDRSQHAIAFTCKDHGADVGEVSPPLRALSHDKSHANAGGQVAVAIAENQRGELREMDVAPSVSVGGGKPGRGYPAVATLAIRGRGDGHNLEYRDDGTANAVLTPNGGRAGIGVGAVHAGMAVRRLTPRECERLQGYPDDYTRIPWRGKPAEQCPDGPRYKALGNSWAIPVVRWIGERIDMVDTALRERDAA